MKCSDRIQKNYAHDQKSYLQILNILLNVCVQFAEANKNQSNVCKTTYSYIEPIHNRLLLTLSHFHPHLMQGNSMIAHIEFSLAT